MPGGGFCNIGAAWHGRPAAVPSLDSQGKIEDIVLAILLFEANYPPQYMAHESTMRSPYRLDFCA